MAGFDGEIKIKSWKKKLKINDKGEYIELNLGDSNCIPGFLNMMKNLQEISDDKDISGNDEEKIDQGFEKHKKAAKEIDDYFGEGTCRKVFGIDYPIIMDIMDFVNAVMEYIEKFTGERLNDFEDAKNKYLKKSKKRAKI